jgi:hypothetical protein
MWLLIWFQLTSQVMHFEVGQYGSEKECFDELSRASVLVTKNNEYLQCFKIAGDTR